MNVRRQISSWSLLVALATIMILPADVSAREPTTSELVDNVVVNVPHAHRRDGASAYVGIRGCRELAETNATLSFQFETNLDTTSTFNGQLLFDGGYYYSVERDQSRAVDCKKDAQCIEIDSGNISQTSDDIIVSLRFRTLTGIGSAAQCDAEDIDEEYLVRIYLRGTYDITTFDSVEARLILDTIRPDPPSNITAFASQSTLQVHYTPSPSGDVSRYVALYSTTPFEGGVLPEELDDLSPRVLTRLRQGVGEASVELEPDDAIYVAIAAQDETGNYSILTEVTQTDVIETIDFWEYYQQQGGGETGGFCNVGITAPLNTHPSGWLGLLMLCLVSVGFRRFGRSIFNVRRRTNGVIAIFLVAMLGSTFVLSSDAYADSPIYGLLEFKLGSYYPSIDDDFSGEDAPFSLFFGDRWMWYGEIEYDLYLYQGIGKLGLGFHAGFSSVTGNAVGREGEDVEVADTTRFRVVPLRLSAVYRYDYSAHHHSIPLVPVVKVGLDYFLWQVTGTDGGTARFDGQRARGGKAGWHASVGLNFHLDVLDRSSAAAFDMNWGINNSFLFAEYVMTRVDGFGAQGFDLSSNQWLFGLAFEM